MEFRLIYKGRLPAAILCRPEFPERATSRPGTPSPQPRLVGARIVATTVPLEQAALDPASLRIKVSLRLAHRI